MLYARHAMRRSMVVITTIATSRYFFALDIKVVQYCAWLTTFS